jgi:asparagine synthase (glutamine-hydrolysing)
MIVRRAMKGVLPEEVRWRGGKTNLYASFKHTLLNLERERLEDLLNKTMSSKISLTQQPCAKRSCVHRKRQRPAAM